MKAVQLLSKNFISYIPENEIQTIIGQLAEKINADFQDKNPIFIGVLNGSFMFVADLMKHISIPCEISFIKLASYRGTETTGKVNELLGLNDDLSSRHVIILEDIVDTGTTLEYLMDILKTHDTASLSIATLLLKPDVFKKKYALHYVGKQIPNKFVVGYGLDYNGQGRNLKEIYQLSE